MDVRVATLDEVRPHHDADEHAWYEAARNGVEFVLTLLLLVVSAPAVLVAAVLVKLTSSGPAFYTQTRLGRHGRPYRIVKLRSMYHDCERHGGARWSTAGDPRVTPVGRWLRKTHLDELPQLWNVLRGEMSLIGPRPERPEFVPGLEAVLPHYRDRLRVRPGLTGLAQVELPPDSDLEGVRRKLACDLYYVAHRSLWLDARILVATALHVLGVSYAWTPRLTALPCGPRVERPYHKLVEGEACLAHVQVA